MKAKSKLAVSLLVCSLNLVAQSKWESLNPNSVCHSINDIHFITADSGFIVTDYEIMVSVDSGNTWGKQRHMFYSEDIDFYKSVGFIVGSIVLKTHDRGSKWDTVDVGVTDRFNTVSVINEDTIIITGLKNVVRSFDGGGTWETIKISTERILKSFFIDANTGHAGCRDGTILKTKNGGKDWYVTESVNTIPSDYHTIYFYNKDIGFASRGHRDLLKTTDGGESWQEIPGVSQAIHSFYFYDEDNGYMIGEFGTFYKTSNGGESWNSLKLGQDGLGMGNYSLFFRNDSVGYVVGKGGSIRKTVNYGNSWFEYPSICNSINDVEFLTDTSAYFSAGEKLYKSVNGGYDWQEIYVSNNGGIKDLCFFEESVGYFLEDGAVMKTVDAGGNWEYKGINNAFSLFFYDEEIGFVSGENVFKTIDGGSSWDNLGEYFLGEIQFVNSKIGYGKNTNYYYKKFYKTIDGGANWISILDTFKYIRSFHFVDEETGFIVGDGFMHKTNDGGNTWTPLEVSEYNRKYVKVRFFNKHIGYVTAINYLHNYLYKTVNGGLTWDEVPIPYIPNLDDRGLGEISFVDSNKVVVAGTNGNVLRAKVEVDSIVIYIYPVLECSGLKTKLRSLIISNGDEINNIYIEYGINDLFDNKVEPDRNIVKANSFDSLTAEISNLRVNKEYSARIKYTYRGKTYVSEKITFSTSLTNDISVFNRERWDVKVYPNPVRSLLTVDSDFVDKIEMLDSNGKIMQVWYNDRQVELSKYCAGLYFIKIFVEDKVIIKKVVKQ